MAKHQTSDLLDELQSNEAYIRNDAIKKIIKGKINDEKITSHLTVYERTQSGNEIGSEPINFRSMKRNPI